MQQRSPCPFRFIGLRKRNAKILKKHFKPLFILFATITVLCQELHAQISPPGLSNTHMASWFALGLDQRLDKEGKRHSTTYIGYGRMSDPVGGSSNALFDKPSMFILNEEYKQKISGHFSYTGAVSYRRQYLYDKNAPFEALSPGYRQEFRLYGKFSYNQSWGKLKWNLDFRPEFRKFYSPSFDLVDPTAAVRFRLKTKAEIPLTEREDHVLLVSAESLFQNDKESQLPTRSWTGFHYEDSRFCLYYRYAPKGLPVYFELGYMDNLAGTDPAVTMHYFAFDIVLLDLFSH